MPIQIGDNSSSTGWSPVTDFRVGSKRVTSVMLATESGLVEVWNGSQWIIGPISENDSVPAPSWAMYADIVLLGAGGGGSGGNGGNSTSGNGGYAGAWNLTVWAMYPGRELEIIVGKGGAGGADSTIAGKPGGTTKVTASDRDWVVTAAGGAGGTGTGGRDGEAAGIYQVSSTGDTWTLNGGGSAGRDVSGKVPGGGGGPGSGGFLGSLQPGRPGGRGQVWIRFRPG